MEDIIDFNAPLRSAMQARRQGRPRLLLLDYDGALVEIASRPELARPSHELLKLLGQLTAQGDLKVIVVSGRPLKDLQELLPVPGLDFLGSHGGEAFIGGRLHPLPVAAVDDQELCRWRNRLVAWLRPFQGWWLEDKPQGFALHYRQVPEEHAYQFIGILGKWREQLRQEGRFQLLAGKKILKIIPIGTGNGLAIHDILSILQGCFGFFPIYIGDDVTDESAIRILQSRGLTIKVGRTGAKIVASHFLPDPEAIRHFLTLLPFPLEDL